MRISWNITENDIERIQKILDETSNNNFVKKRIERNISPKIPPFSKSEFWEKLVACLLTTQQRSGPNSPISKIISKRPFPLNYKLCEQFKNIDEASLKILRGFKGIRRVNNISIELAFNYLWLQDGGWDRILKIANELKKQRLLTGDINLERESCALAQELKGIGPKQARNLWQTLGLTRFEIPIDSRIIKWLNQNELFPFKLSSKGLSDENYYQFIIDGIIQLCNKAKTVPCVLDAAIFSSYDEEWPEDLIY